MGHYRAGYREGVFRDGPKIINVSTDQIVCERLEEDKTRLVMQIANLGSDLAL